jgi:uncharacterized protein YbaR (Trm112 family)
MSLDPQLLEMITCPAPEHGQLAYDAGKETLTCQSCRRVYPVKDGLPVLLMDESVEAN